jgi:hypothetical protein
VRPRPSGGGKSGSVGPEPREAHCPRSRQLWRPTVTHMNNVKIVAVSLRVSLPQVKAFFGEMIEQTHLSLFSILVSKQN